MAGAYVLDGTRSVGISDLATHDFFQKKSACTVHYAKSVCVCVGGGAERYFRPSHLEIWGGGGGGGGPGAPPPRFRLLCVVATYIMR